MEWRSFGHLDYNGGDYRLILEKSLMRILHININYICSALHQTMIEHFDKKKLQNKVFVPTYDKKKSVIVVNDYVILSECFKKMDRFVFRLKQKKIISSLFCYLDIRTFDIVHAHTVFTDGYVALSLFKQYKIPYLVAVRNTDVNVFFKKLLFLRKYGIEVLDNASVIVFLSPVYRDKVLSGYVPKKIREEIRHKSVIIPNGIDDFWLKNIYNRDAANIEKRIKVRKEIRFIYVGNIDKNKNIEMPLKALQRMNANGWNCKLNVIGRISEQKIFNRLKRYSCFNYIAPKCKEDLMNYYRTADIFVMLSHTETFGLVYAEAMSQGLPILYTKGQGFDGQFENDTVGCAVPDENVELLIEAIKNVVNNYTMFSNNAISGVKKFDWTEICRRYEQIYYNIKGGKSII